MKININQIYLDKEVYPRMHSDFVTLSRYINALDSGAKFPPIVVAQLSKKGYVLIDGYHRLEAHKVRKYKQIEAIVLPLKSKKEMYAESVRLNATHGKAFTTQEIAGIIKKLREWKFTPTQISGIVQIPVEKLKPFVVKRVAKIIIGKKVNKDIALKGALKNLAGETLSNDINQDKITSGSQITCIETLISLIENDYIDTKSQRIVSLLKRLYKLLQERFNF